MEKKGGALALMEYEIPFMLLKGKLRRLMSIALFREADTSAER